MEYGNYVQKPMGHPRQQTTPAGVERTLYRTEEGWKYLENLTPAELRMHLKDADEENRTTIKQCNRSLREILEELGECLDRRLGQ